MMISKTNLHPNNKVTSKQKSWFLQLMSSVLTITWKERHMQEKINQTLNLSISQIFTLLFLINWFKTESFSSLRELSQKLFKTLVLS